MDSATTGRTVAAAPAHPGSLTARWWSVFDARIGALPVPVYLVLLAVLAAMTLKGKLIGSSVAAP
jgi:malate:Na+ symporter